MFDSVPSDIDEIYWRCSLKDIRVKLRLYLGHQQALIVQNFQSLATIVSQAFGGKKKNDDVVVPQSKDELEIAFRSVFG